MISLNSHIYDGVVVCDLNVETSWSKHMFSYSQETTSYYVHPIQPTLLSSACSQRNAIYLSLINFYVGNN